MNRASLYCLVVLSLLLSLVSLAARSAEPLFRPHTLLGGEYWGVLPEAGYLDYLAAVKPDLIHGAVVGPELAGCIYDKDLIGITPIYPRDKLTMKDYLDWWREFNAQAHARGIKVQATFSLTYSWGDEEQHSGFFKYYDDLWETDVLGPKPAPSLKDFLSIDANGKFVSNKYDAHIPTNWNTYRGCLNNPLWRQVLKAMVKSGIDAGFDGFMVQFPYFDNRCVCPYCQAEFKKFLAARFTKEELAKECGIDNLETHLFTVIGSADNKYPQLDFAAREFGALEVKDCFDEVFIDYGRALNPGLVVSMWTHFRNFLTEYIENTSPNTNTEFKNIADERNLLPIERWGKGENYLWYSSPVYTGNLKKGVLGDEALDGRVLRAMADGKPFEILRYDYFRWRVTTGESLALGGICLGSRVSGGQDHEEPNHLQTYFQFIRDNDRYLNPAARESYAEVAMIYPRQAILTGDASFFAPFRDIGRALLQGHVLFDVIIDQRMTAADLAKRRAVIVVAPQHLTAAQAALLKTYARGGGKVILSMSGPGDCTLASLDRGVEVVDQADRGAMMQAVAALAGVSFSTFDAPWTVQVYADRQPAAKRVLVHFVNFNRDESQAGKELPIAAAPVKADLSLPAGFKVAGIKFLTPEAKDLHLGFTQQGDRVQFTTPAYLVYGLAMIQGK